MPQNPFLNGAVTAQLKLRLREALQLRLVAEAQRQGRSLNSVIVRRLEDSFRADDHDARLFADPQTFRLLDTIARIVRDAEITSGKSYKDDLATWKQASETICHFLKLPPKLLNHAINGIPILEG